MLDVDWGLVARSWGPMLRGLVVGTIPLTAVSFGIGLVLALVTALARLSRVGALSWVARVYVSVFRGTPLLVQLYIVFYGLPTVGLTIPTWPSAIIAFSLNVGAYASEVVRAAILSVPRGQWEAAATIGMDHGTALRRIVLPQAARVAVPPLSNTLVSLVKDTSLASIVLFTDIFRVAQVLAAPTFQYFPLYVEAAAIYWVVCTALSAVQGRLETRLGRYVAA